MVHIFAGSLIHQGFLFHTSFQRVVDKTHVDVDGVCVWDAVLQPDGYLI